MVEKRPVLFLDKDNVRRQMPGRYVTVRSDREVGLGVVGEDYTPVQNKDAFRFFDAVVGEKLAIYHTAGALGEGERVWILAQLPGTIRVTSQDDVEKFLLLSNGHDGGSSLRMLFTPIRVVCQNTLNVALKDGAGVGAYLRHTANIGMRVEEVRKQLGIVSGLYATFEELSQKMARTPIRRVTDYLTGVLPKPKEGEEMGPRTKKMLEDMVELFEIGKGNALATTKGTVWAAFNAVAEFADYRRPRGGDERVRAESLLWGSGADLKQRAWDSAVALVR
jgi:phage/plasmid-like protein (TIGR03299 family)